MSERYFLSPEQAQEYRRRLKRIEGLRATANAQLDQARQMAEGARDLLEMADIAERELHVVWLPGVEAGLGLDSGESHLIGEALEVLTLGSG
jgi:hypothetical protein